MIYGVDMVNPPTVDQAQKMADLGWTACIVYIGGIRVAIDTRLDVNDPSIGTKWKQQDGIVYPVRDLSSAFTSGFYPTFVGRNLPWDSIADFTFDNGYKEGINANILTGACGFGADSPIFLDIEKATSDGVSVDKLAAYRFGFKYATKGVGHPHGIYGFWKWLATLEDWEVDLKWMASPEFEGRVDYAAPIGSFDPSQPPSSNGWQFGGGSISGISVDFSSWLDNTVLAKYGL